VLLIKEAFDYHDSNKIGLLTPSDLKQALFNMGFFAHKDTVYDLIAECDGDGFGGLTFDAFMRVIGNNPASSENANDLKKVFKKYDK
jgi:Ca2+-binding EF-hand superfamily protein